MSEQERMIRAARLAGATGDELDAIATIDSGDNKVRYWDRDWRLIGVNEIISSILDDPAHPLAITTRLWMLGDNPDWHRRPRMKHRARRRRLGYTRTGRRR